MRDTPNFTGKYPNLKLPLDSSFMANLNDVHFGLETMKMKHKKIPFTREDISPIDSSNNLEIEEQNKSKHKETPNFLFQNQFKVPTLTSLESKVVSRENGLNPEKMNFTKSKKKETTNKSFKTLEIQNLNKSVKKRNSGASKSNMNELNLYKPKTISSGNLLNHTNMSIEVDEQQNRRNSKKKISKNHLKKKTEEDSVSKVEVVASYVYIPLRISKSDVYSYTKEDLSKMTNSASSKSNKKIYFK
jgi:hypothetical protein